MDDYDPASLPADQARALILDSVQPVTGWTRVPLRTALDRVLAEDVRSPIDVPGHTNSAMDGYALRGAELPHDGNARFRIVGTAWAGRPLQRPVATGECARIMTGAAMPEGTDTVLMQEHVEAADDQITVDGRHQPGQNVRLAGEDIARGEVVVAAGRRLTPADLGLVASVGIGEVTVKRRVRVAFFSTGDELRSLTEPLEPGTIYDSNRYTLYSMLQRLGAETIDLGVVRDRHENTLAAFQTAADNADVVISSGGVSVGQADFVRDALATLGDVKFWKVATKPGRPLAFGHVRHAWFFGLPGNPVSVMTTFHLFVRPALRKIMGETPAPPMLLKARCESRLKKKAGRTEFQRGVLTSEDGDLRVTKTGPQGSGILTSMSQANCFIILPLESESVAPGDIVTVLPFSELD